MASAHTYLLASAHTYLMISRFDSERPAHRNLVPLGGTQPGDSRVATAKAVLSSSTRRDDASDNAPLPASSSTTDIIVIRIGKSFFLGKSFFQGMIDAA